MTLVRFAHRFVKERVYYARSQLNVANFTRYASSCIYIDGNIVGNDIKMFDVRDKLKTKHTSGVWTRNCKVIIRKLDGTNQTLSSLDAAIDLQIRELT